MAEGRSLGLPVGQYVTTQLGGKWTPQKARFFDAWAKAEGTVASFNPFATTRRGYPGERNFNEVGVKHYPNLAVGQRATLETLKNGYYDHIVELLRSPNVSAEQLASAVANSPWGTGSGVLRVLGVKQASDYEQTASRQKYTVKKAKVDAPFIAQNAIAAMERNAEKQANHALATRLLQHTNALLTPSEGWLSTLERMGASSGRVAERAARFEPLELPEAPELEAVPQFTPTSTPTTGGEIASVKAPGGAIITSKGWKETPHAGGHTGGLPEFTQPADIMGNPGTPIAAPTSGVITQVGSAQEGGASYYLEGDDGYEYWLGHIDPKFGKGARVKRNQIIATVSGEHPRPHLHIDRRRLR